MAVIEFLGLAFTYTGVRQLDIPGQTLGTVVREIGERFPQFAQRCPVPDQLPEGVTACLNERSFIRDPMAELSSTDRVLLMSADVGG
ncbi:MAG: hypothetical protein DWH91_18835 [Planctomycetota bacterium]|nr:MAG: hypothetical protein DWH91_18835 [Planctomycetota bacterium]